MKRWLLPIALLILGTLLAVGAGWGTNLALGAAIGLKEGESLETVRPGARPAGDGDAVADGDDEDGDTADDGERPAAAGAMADSAPRGLDRKTYISAIMARNIFDSTAIGLVDEPPPCEGENCEYEASDLPVVLLATVVAEPMELSAALLMLENSNETNGYGVGDKILDATITRIETERVIVQRGDGREEFILATEQAASSRNDGVASAEPTGEEGISKVSEEEYVISRELVDQTLSDLDAVSKMARARPHKDGDGNVDGFRLSGVRRNKLLYQIGIRSGDVVHSVNGQPLTSMQEAMGAWQGMQNSSAFEFEITRSDIKKLPVT